MTLQEKFDEYRGEGREEGNKEKQVEIAVKMINDGMPYELICKYTGLNEVEVKNLQIVD